MKMLFQKLPLLLMALACPLVFADSTGYLLGVANSFDLGAYAGAGLMTAIETDAAGYIYLMGETYVNIPPPASARMLGSIPGAFIIKLSPEGDQIVWFTILPFAANQMAVDATGSVYVVSGGIDTNVNISKLKPDGTGFASQVALSPALMIEGLTIDAMGRLWVGGETDTSTSPSPLAVTADAIQKTIPDDLYYSHGFVVRLNPAGNGVDYASYLGGSGATFISGIASDASSLVYISGTTYSSDFPLSGAPASISSMGAGFVIQMTPDGTRLSYAVAVGNAGEFAANIAVDPAGNTVVAQGYPISTITRLNPRGMVIFSKPAPPFNSGYNVSLTTDPTGRTYISGEAGAGNYPVMNSIAPCGSTALTVLAQDGSVLQSTWIPGTFVGYNVNLVGSDGSVYLMTAPSAQGSRLLTRLSTSAPATPLPLACVTDPATYNGANPIAPGELISLFGSGLGPLGDTIPAVTLQSGYPKQLAGVEVSFDGQPAALLYVQNNQINMVVPWSVPPGGNTQVCVTYQGNRSNCIMKQVVPLAPVVFLAADGYALALNQDGTINSHSHPAFAGTIVSMFATGMGAINPAAQDGAVLVPPLPANVLPITAQYCVSAYPISNFPPPHCDPLGVPYAGPAPSAIAGLTQIKLIAGGPTISLSLGNMTVPLTIHVHGFGND